MRHDHCVLSQTVRPRLVLRLGLGLSLSLAAACSETPSKAPDLAQPSTTQDLSAPAPMGVVINEVFPHGADELTDPDWVELKNTTNATVDLSGYQVRDDKAQAPLPLGTQILAGAYLLIYCDDVPDGGAMDRIHVPFKLGGSNDEFTLVKVDGSKADAVTWGTGVVPAGKSYGRLPDGAGPFAPQTPTPGSKNGT